MKNTREIAQKKIVEKTYFRVKKDFILVFLKFLAYCASSAPFWRVKKESCLQFTEFFPFFFLEIFKNIIHLLLLKERTSSF